MLIYKKSRGGRSGTSNILQLTENSKTTLICLLKSFNLPLQSLMIVCIKVLVSIIGMHVKIILKKGKVKMKSTKFYVSCVVVIVVIVLLYICFA
jgi:hypothetical protein